MFGINLGSLKVKLGADATGFEAGTKKAESQMKHLEASAMKLGATLTKYVTVPLTIMGGASVKYFGDFNQAMTESTAIMSDVTSGVRDEMERTALAVSKRGIKTAEELARSYFYLASAGYSAEQSIKNLPVVEKFATAGMFDMALATDLLTDAQSALGLSSKDVEQNTKNSIRLSDILVKANTLANASVLQFSTALTNKAGPALRLLNKDVEEGVAVLSAYADQGIKGERAGEAFSIISRDLQRSIIAERKQWDKLGISVYDSMGTMLNYADILEQLESKFSSMSDEQKKMTAEQLGFQDRSFAYLQTLIGTSDKIREYEKALRDAGGTTERVAKKQLGSLNSQLKITFNYVKSTAISIGKILSPIVLKLSKVLKSVLVFWEKIPKFMKEFIVYSAMIMAVLGPILVAFGMFSALIIPIGILVAKVGALSVALGVLSTALINSGKAKIVFEEISKSISYTTTAMEQFYSNFAKNQELFSKWFSDNWKYLIRDIGTMLRSFFTNTLLNLATLMRTIRQLLKEYVKSVFSLDIPFLGGKEKKKQSGERIKKIMVDMLASYRTPLEGFKSEMEDLPLFDFGNHKNKNKIKDQLKESMKYVSKTASEIFDDITPGMMNASLNTSGIGETQKASGSFKTVSLNRFALPTSSQNLPSKNETQVKGMNILLEGVKELNENVKRLRETPPASVLP